MKHYVFTCGDINGIGPEICLKTFNKILPNKNLHITYICPGNVFLKSCKFISPKFDFKIADHVTASNFEAPVTILNIKNAKLTPGKPTKSAGKISFNSVVTAIQMVQNNLADAIITAPISKTALNHAGINFTGHTEILAEYTSTKNYVMTFLSTKMKCALTTIHIPVNKISKTLTRKKLRSTINVCINSLRYDLGIANPKIAVLALNPHAGELGSIGSEELKVIIPVINEQNDCIVDGPFVPDAYFGNRLFKNYDMTIGMYHDQLLVPFKLLNFERGVNFTAGLPIVRTSPDHGTAFDIAWKNKASETSMVSAFNWARKIVKQRQLNAR